MSSMESSSCGRAVSSASARVLDRGLPDGVDAGAERRDRRCRDVPRTPPGAGRARPRTPPTRPAGPRPWRSAGPAACISSAAVTRSAYWRAVVLVSRVATGGQRRWIEAMTTPAVRSDRSFIARPPARAPRVAMATRTRHAVTMSSMAMCSVVACSSTIPVGSATQGIPLALKKLPSVPPPTCVAPPPDPAIGSRRGLAVGLRVFGDLVGLVDRLGIEVDGGAVVVRRLLTRLAHGLELAVELALVVASCHPLEDDACRARCCGPPRRRTCRCSRRSPRRSVPAASRRRPRPPP